MDFFCLSSSNHSFIGSTWVERAWCIYVLLLKRSSSAVCVLLFSFFAFCCTQHWICLLVLLILCPQKMRVYNVHAHCVSSLSNCIIWWEAKKFFGFNGRVCVWVCVYWAHSTLPCLFPDRIHFIFENTKNSKAAKRNTHLLFLFFSCTVFWLVVLLFWPDFVQLIYPAHCLWYLPAL